MQVSLRGLAAQLASMTEGCVDFPIRESRAVESFIRLLRRETKRHNSPRRTLGSQRICEGRSLTMQRDAFTESLDFPSQVKDARKNLRSHRRLQ